MHISFSLRFRDQSAAVALLRIDADPQMRRECGPVAVHGKFF
jgi:hypothetical protein